MLPLISLCKKLILAIGISLIVFYSGIIALAVSPDRVNSKLAELESKTGTIDSIQTDFEQRKKLAMFTKEIIIEGKLSIAKPDMFSWHVYKPVKYGLVVKDDQISQWNADTDRVKTISMKDNPAFTAIFDQMNNWLSGNYKSLKADYNITIFSESPLTLKFIPLQSALSHKFISGITVYFDSDLRYLKKIEIIEESGDKTSLTFSNTVLNEKIPGNAWNAEF